MTFDQAAVSSLVDRLVSIAQGLGVFRSVNMHEPKSAPGAGVRLAIWVQSMEALPRASGLASGSGYVTVSARVYGNMLQKPEDDVDPRLMTAMTTLMGAYCADFDFGGTIRNIDIFGHHGTKMSAVAGYLTIDQHLYRIMTLTVPCIINDMWILEP